jgi:hypothetical protein
MALNIVDIIPNSFMQELKRPTMIDDLPHHEQHLVSRTKKQLNKLSSVHQFDTDPIAVYLNFLSHNDASLREH